MPGIFRQPWRQPPQIRWIPTAAPAGGTTINVDTPGQITWTGSSVTLAFKETVTGGTITWTGSTVTLATKVPVTGGTVTWTGSSVTLAFRQVVTGGVVTWTGSSVTLAVKVPVTGGTVTWTGSTGITLQTTGPVEVPVTTAGQITWTGSSITLAYQVIPTPGVVTWTGSDVVLKYAVVIVSGTITWTGQTITLTLPGTGEPVKGPTRKTSLVGVSSQIEFGLVGADIDDAIAAIDSELYDMDGLYVGRFDPTDADLIGSDDGDNDAEELVGAPRAVLIGSGRNSLVEV